MFIYLTYKDAAELSTYHRQKSAEVDESVEKQLLINPNCYARVMLEYIREKCGLVEKTHFDLCDEAGSLKGLFTLPTFANVMDLFVNKGVYYLIVMRHEKDTERFLSIIPQLNRENKLYAELQTRVRKYLADNRIRQPW